jgi:hypothetical protein
MTTYVLKINVNEEQDIKRVINEIVGDTNIPLSPDKNEITFMSKAQYAEFMLANSGNVSPAKKEDNMQCTICNENCRSRQKVFKMNLCGHKFHHKCIDILFKNSSSNQLLSCPTCNSSTEELCNLDELIE